MKWEIKKKHYDHPITHRDPKGTSAPQYTHEARYKYSVNKYGLPEMGMGSYRGARRRDWRGNTIHVADVMPEGMFTEQLQMCWLNEMNRGEVVKTKKRLKELLQMSADVQYARPSHGHGGRGWYNNADYWMDKTFKASSFEYDGKQIEVHRRRTIRQPNRIQYSYGTDKDYLEIHIDGRRFPDDPEQYYPRWQQTAFFMRLLHGKEEILPPLIGMKYGDHEMCYKHMQENYASYYLNRAIREGEHMECAYCREPVFNDTGATTHAVNNLLLWMWNTKNIHSRKTDVYLKEDVQKMYREEVGEATNIEYQGQWNELYTLHDLHVEEHVKTCPC